MESPGPLLWVTTQAFARRSDVPFAFRHRVTPCGFGLGGTCRNAVDRVRCDCVPSPRTIQNCCSLKKQKRPRETMPRTGAPCLKHMSFSWEKNKRPREATPRTGAPCFLNSVVFFETRTPMRCNAPHRSPLHLKRTVFVADNVPGSAL